MPNHGYKNIHFMASRAPVAQSALVALQKRYGHVALGQAEIIVALGGDGFMLSTLHETMSHEAPVYGMNRGTVGFLMNEYSEEGLLERLAYAEEALINPLKMIATRSDSYREEALAINEVSLIRAGAQAAKIRIDIDGRTRMEELISDGVMVSTPAGSTAYNYSAHGPIIPITAEILALTPVAAFRPRRWRGALLPKSAKVTFHILDTEKRPVSATADSHEVRNVSKVEIMSESDIEHRILFDPGHGLEERLLREQFI